MVMRNMMCTMENGKMVKDMEKAVMDGRTVMCTMDNGIMVNSMEEEL